MRLFDDWLTKRLSKILDRQTARGLVGWRKGHRHFDARAEVRSLHRWAGSWVFICADKNATAVSMQPLKLLRRKNTSGRPTKSVSNRLRAYVKATMPLNATDQMVEVESHPVLDLLDRPNPLLGQRKLLWLTAMYLQLNGNAYWRQLVIDGQPRELWPLPSHYVYPILDDESVFGEYEFRMYSAPIKYPANEIIHFRKPSVLDTLSGFGDLRAIIHDADTDKRMMEYEQAVFENMARPDVFFSPKDATTAGQMTELLNSWNAKHQGWMRAGKAGGLPFPVDVSIIDAKNKDLEFTTGKAVIRDKICAGFGVPSTLFNPEGTTFNNMDFGLQSWARYTLKPLLLDVADVLNVQLMPMYAPGADDAAVTDVPLGTRNPWFLTFDDPVPEDIDGQTARDASDVAAGLEAVNDIRRARGEEPYDPIFDEPFIQAGLVPASRATDSLDAELAMGQAQIDGQQRQAEAPPTVTPPTYAELTTSLQAALPTGDVDLVNAIRLRMTELLGRKVPDLDEIKPAPSAAIVDPSEEELETSRPLELKQETANGAEPKRQAENEEQTPEAKETRKEDKPKDKALRGADLENHWCRTIVDEYGKLSQQLTEPEARDRSFEKKLANLFAQMEAVVKANAAKLVEKSVGVSSEGFKHPRRPIEVVCAKMTADDIAHKLYDRKSWIERFEETSFPFLELSFRRGADLGVQELQRAGISGDLLDNTEVLEQVRKQTAAFASKVVDLTGEQLVEAVGQAILEGESAAVLAQKIGAVYGNKKDKHAKLIARTELNTALNTGAVATWQKSGIKKKEWLAPADACEFCQVLKGRVVPIGQVFVRLGTTLIGRKGGKMKINYRPIDAPTLHPNCTCTVLPVIEL